MISYDFMVFHMDNAIGSIHLFSVALAGQQLWLGRQARMSRMCLEHRQPDMGKSQAPSIIKRFTGI